MQRCDQCERHCPVDALQCGRGRSRFGLTNPNEQERREMPDGPIGLLQQCGHVLHHGGVGGDDPLRALSAQERAELERLLSLLLADWKTRAGAAMPSAHPGHHHG